MGAFKVLSSIMAIYGIIWDNYKGQEWCKTMLVESCENKWHLNFADKFAQRHESTRLKYNDDIQSARRNHES